MGYWQNYFKPETESVKMLARICQILKTKQWPANGKCSIHLPISKKGDAKEFSNYRTIALISHPSKEMLKVKQQRLLLYYLMWNKKCWMFKVDTEKEDTLKTGTHWVLACSIEFQKVSLFFKTTLKLLTVPIMKSYVLLWEEQA